MRNGEHLPSRVSRHKMLCQLQATAVTPIIRNDTLPNFCQGSEPNDRDNTQCSDRCSDIIATCIAQAASRESTLLSFYSKTRQQLLQVTNAVVSICVWPQCRDTVHTTFRCPLKHGITGTRCSLQITIGCGRSDNVNCVVGHNFCPAPPNAPTNPAPHYCTRGRYPATVF